MEFNGCKMKDLLSVLILIFYSASAFAEDIAGIRKVQSTDGVVEIPITGSEPTYWSIYNECVEAQSGYAKPNEKVKYSPHSYGDKFFFEQYSGDVSRYLENQVYFRIIGRSSWCNRNAGDVKNNFLRDVDQVSAGFVAQIIFDLANDERTRHQDYDYTRLVARIPNTCRTALPSISDSNAVNTLANCLNISDIRNRTISVANTMLRYPTPAINQNGIISTYAYRRQFSTMTAKASYAYSPELNTPLTIAHISVYPFAAFDTPESWKNLDRLSLDVGVASPTGSTADADFSNSDSRFVVGIGFDLSESFSFQVMNVIWSDSNSSHNDFALGISYDVLGLLGKINK